MAVFGPTPPKNKNKQTNKQKETKAIFKEKIA